jgi:hypothetical protein
MDCQEWKDKDLSEGYKQFEQDLDKVFYIDSISLEFQSYRICYYSTQQLLQLDVLLLIQRKHKKMTQKGL